MQPLSIRLRLAREKRGKTVEAAAAELGCHPKTLSAWERGLNKPRDLDALARLYPELELANGKRRSTMTTAPKTTKTSEPSLNVLADELKRALAAASEASGKVAQLRHKLEQAQETLDGAQRELEAASTEAKAVAVRMQSALDALTGGAQ